ncbi:MAG: YncE family protein [Flavobacteriales bacterium]|nr:YncE family protein [Flavobacteriales bacterium]
MRKRSGKFFTQRMNGVCSALLLMVVVAACRKDKPEAPVAAPVQLGQQGGAYITNEGNFLWGNSGVSYYDNASGSVFEDLFQSANGTALGDVCQSMTLFNGTAYLVVNNSDKVVLVDPNTFAQQGEITGFVSPRYLLPVSNAKAYVTDLAGDAIAVVDLVSRAITGTIPCPGATEELVLAVGKAFVTNTDREQLYVIDTATDAIVDSITVGRGANSLVQDANGKLWVLCSGYMGLGNNAVLHRVDPASLQVEASFTFPSSSDSPWRLRINGGHDQLYFLNNDVYRMPITAVALPTAPFIAAVGRNFYGLGVDPGSDVVYAADAVDYVQRGVVYRYAQDGAVLNSFHVGIIPGGFSFR